MGKSTAVVERDKFRELIHDKAISDALKIVLPKHLTPERIVQLALMAGGKYPNLRRCDPTSVVKAICDVGTMGLEPCTPLQHAALIPYGTECQFQIMYRGMVELARRSGDVLDIDADVVHANDYFRYVQGTERKVEHIKWELRLDKDKPSGGPGNVIAAYAIAFLKNGIKHPTVVMREELDKIEKTSKAKRPDSPWKQWKEEMQKKTAIKRLAKLIPQSPELAKAIELDNVREGVIDTDFEIVPDKAEQQEKLKAGRHKVGKKKKADLAQEKGEAAATQETPPESQPGQDSDPALPAEDKPTEDKVCDREFAENGIENLLQNMEVSKAFDGICEGIGIDPKAWTSCSDAQLKSLLSKCLDIKASNE